MPGFISLADAKAQLRVTSSSEDALITSFINAASLQVEKRCGFVAGQRDETFTFDRFGRQLELRLRPVDLDTIEVVYLDPNGDEQSFTDIRVLEKDGTVRIVPAIRTCWPTTACTPGAIKVTANVGFEVIDDDGAAAAPENVKHAVRVCVARWYQDREQGPLPNAFFELLDDDRATRV